MKRSVSVIGAGHAGCAIAFDCAQLGFAVTLRSIEGHPGNNPRIEANGGYIEATGQRSGRQHVRVCYDFDLGMPLTDTMIIIALPSQGHDAALAALARYDLSKSTLVFFAGNGVAVKASAQLNAQIICDAPTSPYSSRVTAEGAVSIRGSKKRLQIGSLPADISDQSRAEIGRYFVMPLQWSANVLEMFFAGLNGVVHVPTALMNMGWIESTGGDFYFYRQGMSQGVCNVIAAADAERLAVGKAYRCSVVSALATFNLNYGMNEKTMCDFANRTDAHNKTKGAQKRFLSQDVPYWLVTCSELGRRAGVPTPSIDILILLASTFSGIDYRSTGRTLKALGLGDASVEGIIAAFAGHSERCDSVTAMVDIPCR